MNRWNAGLTPDETRIAARWAHEISGGRRTPVRGIISAVDRIHNAARALIRDWKKQEQYEARCEEREAARHDNYREE